MDSTVGYLYEQTKLKMLRFYIRTKQEVCLTDVESLSDGEKEECNEHSTLGLDSDTERPAEKLLSHGCDSDSEDSITHLLDDGLSSKRDTERKVSKITKTLTLSYLNVCWASFLNTVTELL